MPPDEDGSPARDQARVRTISASLFDEAVRRSKRSPRKVGERLAELGWFGRGGEPYNESSVRGWMAGQYSPPTFVAVAMALDVGLSIDDLMYGTGLKAEVDRLREATDAGNRELAKLQRDVELLAGVVTRHVQLDPDATRDVGRIVRRDQEPG